MDMWVKVCGVTRREDALACAEAGADAVGLNFFDGPRRIDLERAADVLAAVPKSLSPIALVGCREDRVEGRLLIRFRELGIKHLQLYGDVRPTLLQDLGRMSFQSIVPCRVADADFALRFGGFLREAEKTPPWAVLLDACDPQRAGGTGQTFHWEWVAQARDRGLLAGWPNIILAGGLTPENIVQAVSTVKPFGVDVSSGVESAPGVKSRAKVRAFIQAVRGAEPSRRLDRPI